LLVLCVALGILLFVVKGVSRSVGWLAVSSCLIDLGQPVTWCVGGWMKVFEVGSVLQSKRFKRNFAAKLNLEPRLLTKRKETKKRKKSVTRWLELNLF
jgi:uncharacterized membrane protein